ncbi:MAG TPA: hypothetical protein PKC30_11370 [Saprospiraceae bacterium]|nr:hypothetical protein [Saprospiraceae bacterium]
MIRDQRSAHISVTGITNTGLVRYTPLFPKSGKAIIGDVFFKNPGGEEAHQDDFIIVMEKPMWGSI